MLCVTHIWNETTNSANFWGIPCFEMSKLGARLALQDPKDDEIRLPAKAESGVFVIAGWFTPVRCEAAGRLLVRLRCR